MRELTSFIQRLWTRLPLLIANAPAGTLPLTGVLGLALILGLNYLRRTGQRKPDEPSSSAGGSSSSGPAGPSGLAAPGGGPASGVQGRAAARSGLAARLGGARRITISAPGVLLEEWSAQDLEDSATMLEGAATLLQDMSGAAEVYILCHVESDIGEATVRGALEAGGVLGGKQGQIQPHRVLFCGSVAGKVSVVRQLEPDVHIDGNHLTVDELRRFLPRLLHVQRPADPAAGAGPATPNIRVVPSLAAAFGAH